MKKSEELKLKRLAKEKEAKKLRDDKLSAEERAIDRITERISDKLKAMKLDAVPEPKDIEPNLISINKNLVALIEALTGGLNVKNIDQARVKRLEIANQIQIPKDLATTGSIKAVVEAIDQNKKVLGAIAKAVDANSQRPEDFMPVRRVYKSGNRFLFDDTSTGSYSGGGGGGVQEIGADHMDTGQKSIDGVASAIVGAREGRRGVLITNLGATDVYIGSDSSVATNTGSLLLGTKGTAIFVPTTTAIYAITGGGTVSISYIEVY